MDAAEHAALHKLYKAQGLTEEQIGELLVLDVWPQSYFTERGFQDQHAGGQAFAHEPEIMGWLFSKTRHTASQGNDPTRAVG